jgi:hypothetical protein
VSRSTSSFDRQGFPQIEAMGLEDTRWRGSDTRKSWIEVEYETNTTLYFLFSIDFVVAIYQESFVSSRRVLREESSIRRPP